jgi:phosphoribosylaminoimidazole carboxylase (NCAIR synthetase)
MDSRTGLPVVGMVGGGHLVRMSHQAAIALGQSLRVLVPAADDGAALVAADVHVGDPTDLATLRAFAEGCDVLTFGPAVVPVECVRALANEGIVLYPGAGALQSIEDRRAAVRAREGSRLAALVARSPFGQVAAYPVVRVAPGEVLAPELDTDLAVEAQRLAIELATTLGLVGLLAVELSQTPDGVLVNDLATGPLDCGLWTVEGSRTSQFEQHLRAVLDYPLGETSLTAPAVATATVPAGTSPMSLDERLHHLFADDPGAKVHLYGTGERIGQAAPRARELAQRRPGTMPDRSHALGHVTVLGDDLPSVRARAARAARWLAEGRH